MKSRTLVAGFGVLWLAGCASVPRDAGFGEVQSVVLDRTGRLVQWNRRTTDDQAVAAKISAMLATDLTADEVVQIALLNNRHLQATFEDLGIAQADLVQAGLLKNPVFDLSVRFPDRSPPRTYLDIGVAEDFLDVALLPARKQLAAEQFEQTKARVTSHVLALVADASSAFYSYQAARQTVEFDQAIAQAAAASLDVGGKLHDAGNENDLEYAGRRAQDAQARADLADAQAQADEARERVTNAMGLAGSETQWTAVVRMPDIPPIEINFHDLESVALRQRLDVAVARKEVAIQARTLGLTRQYRFFQNVNLGPEAERETDGQWRIGPTLSMPIPLFDQGQATVARAVAVNRQCQQRLDALEVDVRSQVRAARTRLLHAREKVILYRDEVLPIQQEVLRQSQLHYNGMYIGVFQLLQAKRDQIDAARHSIEALRDYWIAVAELQRAVGGRLENIPSTHPTGEKP